MLPRKRSFICSNLFSIPEQVGWPRSFVSEIGPGKMLFCNSGAEANEGLIKFARLASNSRIRRETQDPRSRERVSRATMEPRPPILPNTARDSNRYWAVWIRPAQRPRCLRAKLDDETIAVLIEPIVEGGIHEAKDDFLQGLERLCRERKALLMLDEGPIRHRADRGFPRAIRHHAGRCGLGQGLGGGSPSGRFGSANNTAEFSSPEAMEPPLVVPPWLAAAHAVLGDHRKGGTREGGEGKGLALREGLSRLVERFPSILRRSGGDAD